jgi:hypothetical protein
MNNLNWERERQRFMTVAYERTQKAAKRAFWRWHEWKRDDAIQESVGKVWDSWSRLLLRGRDPEPLLAGIIRFAVLWTRYDRRIAGRARTPDVFDYRSGLKRQLLSDHGEACPTDRGDPRNSWIDWDVQTGDDPGALAAVLEQTGITLAQWFDL